VDGPAAAEGLVDPVRVESQLADEAAVDGDDANIGAGDQEVGLAVAVLGADADVAEFAEVADGDAAVGVDAVVANPVVGWAGGLDRSGFEAGAEDGQGVSADLERGGAGGGCSTRGRCRVGLGVGPKRWPAAAWLGTS